MKMKRILLLCTVATSLSALATETLFTNGPHELEGAKYYWLAEWKLEVTIPHDAAPGQKLQVLFGTKGKAKRTLYFQHGGKTDSVTHVGVRQGFDWIDLPLPNLKAGDKVALSGKKTEQVAFLAGVRMTGESASAPTVKPIRTRPPAPARGGRPSWSDLPGFEMTDETRRLWDPAPREPDWERAERSSRYAGIALDKVQRWLRDNCMAVHDEKSGLFRPTGRIWNYRDTAADCYPFYIWAAFYTDQKLLNTVMVETLEAEQRLCNHLDRLPVPYDMDAQKKVPGSHDAMIFEASEYAKDGLVPIIEITGPRSPWFARLQGIIDDIFKHARIDSPYGKIPSTNIEVNGELLQILPRLYRITGDRKYLEWAFRLADYYLLPGRFVPSKLYDHGCEIVGGLGLLFAVALPDAPDRCRKYEPHLEYMFDEILRRGTNFDGVIIGNLQSTPGPHDRQRLGDGWGYDFVGFLDYDMARGSKRYMGAVKKPLGNLLKPRYYRFNWDHGSRDNVADSVEGGLYLLRQLPAPEGFLWADREIATLLVDHSNPDRLWGVHKLEANTVRTVLIHTMLHTRNTIARPWRQGLQLGAAPIDDGIYVFVKSREAYEGRIQFDIPRHRIYMGFKRDWPRMNAVPEWFSVEPDDEHRYAVKNVDDGTSEVHCGKSLAEGLPVSLETNKPLRLIVRPVVRDASRKIE